MTAVRRAATIALVLAILLPAGYKVHEVVFRLRPAAVITWSLDLSDWPGYHLPAPAPAQSVVAAYLNDELNHDTGWRRAGLIFQYQPANGAVKIVLENQDQIQRRCNLGKDIVAEGCIRYATPRSCRIWLQAEVRLIPNWNQYSYKLPSHVVIDHELGHCFGFHHTKTGLMKAVYDADDPAEAGNAPSPAMIETIRRRLPDQPTAMINRSWPFLLRSVS